MKKIVCPICGQEMEVQKTVESNSWVNEPDDVFYRYECKKCGLLTPIETDRLQAKGRAEYVIKKILDGEYPEVVERFRKK